MRLNPLLSLAVLAALTLPAGAASRKTPRGETDIAISGSGSFAQTATGNGMTQTSPDWFGGIFEIRHSVSPLKSFEAAYSMVGPHYSTYTTSVPITPSGFPCKPSCTFTPGPSRFVNFSQTLSADWVPTIHRGRFRPFAVLGIGLLIATPDAGQVNVVIPSNTGGKPVLNAFSLTSQVTAAYIYGAGTDWAIGKRWGLRLQYRGEMYKAPDLAPSLYPATNAFIQNAEPSVGIYFGL